MPSNEMNSHPVTKRCWPSGLRTVVFALAAVLFSGPVAFAQPPIGPPGSDMGEGMPWQVAALFTANWVMVAIAVAMMSRPTKRSDKPKKKIDEEAQA
jgi:hypothetical protein